MAPDAPWLQAKLDAITSEFLSGGGHGAVYEAQFLAYLDCLLVARGAPSSEMWAAYREACRQATPEGVGPRCFALNLPHRKTLVEALQAFQEARLSGGADPETPPGDLTGLLDFFDGQGSESEPR